MSTETQNNAPVSAEPVYQLWSDEGFGGWTDTDKATYCWRLGSKNPPRMRKLYTAPVAAQPDLAQQTLDDVMAGIPARDAEIAALRKEIDTLRAQQDADKVDAWQCTTTLQVSDDLIWLYCQDTNTIDGPVKSNPEFIDAWTHWAWVTHPSTTAIDAARKEEA